MSLIVDVPDEVERVVRTPADDPHTSRQLEAFLSGKKYDSRSKIKTLRHLRQVMIREDS